MEDVSLTNVAGLLTALGPTGVLSVALYVVWRRYTDLQDTINTILFRKLKNLNNKRETGNEA